MAHVYVNDVLQTSPIKLKTKTTINVDFSFPTNAKAKHVIAFVYEGELYVHKASALYKWTGTSWESQDIGASEGLGNTNNLECLFSGVYDNKMYFISKYGTVTTFDGEEYTKTTMPSSDIRTTLNNLGVAPDPWGFVHNNKIHIFGTNGKHITYDKINGFEDISSQDSGLNYNNTWHILSYNGRIMAMCDDLNRQQNKQRYIMDYNESTHVWTEVITEDGSNSLYLTTARDSVSDLRNDKKCIDDYNYIHVAGTSNSYSSSNVYWDGMLSIAPGYGSTETTNGNTFGDYIPGDIIDYDGYIWLICGYKYGSTSTNDWTSRVIRIDDTARLQYYQNWSSGYNKKVYKFVSCTVYFSDGTTKTYDANGDVV